MKLVKHADGSIYYGPCCVWDAQVRKWEGLAYFIHEVKAAMRWLGPGWESK